MRTLQATVLAAAALTGTATSANADSDYQPMASDPWISGHGVTLMTTMTEAGSPARADGEVLWRTIFLASRAGEYGGYTTLIPNDRRIWLAAGDYHWTHRWNELYPDGTARTAYNLRLGQGWHYWNCHVLPHPTDFWRYQTRCYLRPEGKGNIYSPMLEIQPHGWSEWNGYIGSDYIWESTLTLL